MQVSAAGPDTVALVYLSGFGLQFNGDNFFVPVDADLARDVDIPLQAIRVADFAQPLAALPARVKIVILDAARQNPFARGDQPLASGLALVDAVPGMAIAFNAAPGTVGPEEPGPYGAYATALTEMIAAGGLSLDDIFARVRLRVSNLTQGAEIPWYVSQIGGPFFMTERAADAPPPPNVLPVVDIRDKPLRDFASVDDAYAAVLALDTIEGYEQFLAIYSYSPYSQRVAAMLAVRREEIVWRRCVTFDTPQAYWSYLRRYPNGPHSWDARRRLAILRATLDPPPQFAFVDFGMPPPPPAELVFIDQPILIFAGPGWAPPPPPPVIFLPPRPREFARAAASAAAQRTFRSADAECGRRSGLREAAARRCGAARARRPRRSTWSAAEGSGLAAECRAASRPALQALPHRQFTHHRRQPPGAPVAAHAARRWRASRRAADQSAVRQRRRRRPAVKPAPPPPPPPAAAAPAVVKPAPPPPHRRRSDAGAEARATAAPCAAADAGREARAAAATAAAASRDVRR